MAGEQSKRNWTPWLVIRADDADAGLRPLAQGDVFYESPDIWVESPDPSGQVVAGEPNFVNARIFNLGKAPAAPTRVDFYWGDPSVGLSAADMNLIGTEWVEVDPLRSLVVRCSTPWVPVLVNGGHECLIVNASNAILDPIQYPFQAALDRHVGQRNLTGIEAAPGSAFGFTVAVKNPWRRDGQTVVTARADRVGLVNPPPRWRLTRGLIDQAVAFGAAGRPSAAELRSMYREGTPEARTAALLAGIGEAGAAFGATATPTPVLRREPGGPGSITARLDDHGRIVPDPDDVADAHLARLLLASTALAGACRVDGSTGIPLHCPSSSSGRSRGGRSTSSSASPMTPAAAS